MNQIKFFKGIFLAACFAVSLITVKAQNYLPKSYYTFDSATPMKDSMGFFNLDPNYYTSGYSINSNSSGVGVGRYMTLDSNSTIIRGGTLAIDSAVTVEFLFKPGFYFGTTVFCKRMDGALELRMDFPHINFMTNVNASNGSSVYDDFQITLDGIGRKSYGYYIDGNWHHIVFKYNAKSGIKEVWIDGQLPSGFSKTLTGGSFATSGNRDYMINSQSVYYKYQGALDEFAIYYNSLGGNSIYSHYLNFMANQHYSFANPTVTAPTPSAVTAGIDVNEYAPGHPSPTMTPIDQMKNFPTPRYKPGHSLYPNNPFVGYYYLSGYQTYESVYANAVANSVTLQTDFAKNFNYMLMASENTGAYTDYSNPTTFSNAWINLANQNPQLKVSALSYWPQLNPSNAGFKSSQPYATCQCLPDRYYLKNSSGQYLNPNGGTGSQKYLSPAGPTDSLKQDGLTQKYYLQQLLNKLTRPLDYILDNGEVIPFLYYTNVMTSDPSVVSDKNSTGLDWFTYEGRRASEKIKSYRDQFMPTLSGLANTKFAYYQLDGQPTWNLKWSEVRSANTPMNGNNYATGDLYVRYPGNWRYWSGAWHGWQWLVESRKEQLASGDKYFSPAVSPGWDNDETQNVRPGQWLGFLKAVSMTGAEFFTTGYFVVSQPYQNPKNYVWQLAIPPYAQAITSRYEDLFRNGYLMSGDVPNSTTNPQWNAYSFYAGDPRKLVVARKSNSGNKYAITGTIQPSSNMAGATELEGVAKINLDGQSLKFKVRRQGSTYIYDNTNTASPVFYQLDGWHENTYPTNWSKDFNFEAELFDNANTSVYLKTTRPSGTAAGDFTNYTTAVGFNSVSDLTFNFQPRSTTASTNFYVWVLARSKNGQTTGMTINLDAGTSYQIGCVTDTNWVWYRYNLSNATAIAFTSVANRVDHILKLTPSNTNLEIDKILLSTNSGVLYSNPQPCASNATATISASGPLAFCAGGSVTLTASTGNSYLWSTGATTQSIAVSLSGTYSVTVTSASGSASATPVTVSVYSLPSALVTASGSTNICSGSSVTLTASNGSTFLWSPGNQTTQSISVNTGGNYAVQVTNANGCTATSFQTTVTVNAAPTATISAGGATTFCQGGNVKLTASTGSSYLWSPNGETTSSITTIASGNYSVQVSNAAGCTATSAATTVTVKALPTATISASGATTFAQGGSVTLTSSTAGTNGTYLWTPGGQTTQAITVNATGNYGVKVTNSSGCSATSTAVAVTVTGTVTAPKITASGPTTFCQGGSVTLTCSAANSYLWSTGATTQSITVSTTGTYSCTATTSSGTATATPVSVVVTTPTAASISASGSTTFCQGGSVTLTASTGTSYLWSNGATTQSITPSSSGNYTVAVTNNGCTANAPATAINVIAPPTATITASGSTTFAQGGSVTLTASSPGSGGSYLWLPAGQTTQSITVSATGNYSVMLTNSNGCSATSAATAVMVTGTATATITVSGNLTFCQGGSVILTATKGAAYNWSNGKTTRKITVTQSGSYAVTVTALNTGALLYTNPVTVTVNPLPSTTITASGATTFCSGSTINLTAPAAASYLWSPGSQTTQSIAVSASGSYTVRTTNSYGCSATSAATVVTVNNCNSTCQTPGNLTTTSITGSSAQLNWSVVPATNFYFKVENLNTGALYSSNAVINTVNSLTIGVAKSTNYRWAIRSLCGTTYSAWSNWVNFTTPALRTSDPGFDGSINDGNLTPLFAVTDAELESGNIPMERLEEVLSKNVSIYPNPASWYVDVALHAEHKASAKLTLRDLTGRTVSAVTVAVNEGVNMQRMDLRHVAKGTYVLFVEMDKQISSHKVVIE